MKIKKGKKTLTPFKNGDLEVNQRKITTFFKKVDPNSSNVSSTADKSHVQTRLSFSRKVKNKNTNVGSSSIRSSSSNLKSSKVNKTIKTQNTNKNSITINDSDDDDDVIILLDSNDSKLEENKDKTNSNNVDKNKGSGNEPEKVNNKINPTEDVVPDGEEDGGITKNSREEFSIPSLRKQTKRVLFTSEDETQKIEDSGLDSKDIETQGVVPLNGIHIPDEDEDIAISPFTSPATSNKSNTGRSYLKSRSETDEACSPSLLENYKPNPSLFENHDSENSIFDNQSVRKGGSVSNTPTRSVIITAPSEMFSPSHVGKTPSKTPAKSPKPETVYFSPVRHLNARERSNSNTRSPSSNSSGSTTYGSQSTSVSVGGIQSTYATPVKNSSQPPRDPYFLEYFKTVLYSVASDDFHSHLFIEDDWRIIEAFNELSKSAMCLYVRLYNRRWGWKQADKIKYPDIAENLIPAFNELYRVGYLLEVKDKKIELDDLLDLLTGEQMTILGKKMHLGVACKTKEKIKLALTKITTQQRTLQGSSSDAIHKLALENLGPTYKVSENSKNLFSRIFNLHSPPQYWEDDGNSSSSQAFTMLLTNTGKMEYPVYKVFKSTKIYSTREDLLRFQDAWTLHSEIQRQLESKNWIEVEEIMERALQKLKLILQTPSIQQHDKTLPVFLRAYTAGSVCTRVVWIGVEALQKTKQYLKANEIIEFLTSQTDYLTQYRGRWHERLVINAKQHLKKSNSELWELIKRGLNDEFVQDSHRFGLTVRLEKIKEEKPKKRVIKKAVKRRTKKQQSLVDDSNDEEEDDLDGNKIFNIDDCKICVLNQEIPSRTIEGEKMSVLSERNYGKSVFVGASTNSNGNTNTVSSVELFAIDHFRNEGYINGVHGEGSVPVVIFGLLFWDIIYNDDIPDVFHNPFQPFPLDFHFEDFYKHRSQQIQEFLNKLQNGFSLNDVFQLIDERWENNVNKICIVNWDVFENAAQVKSLVKCMGLQMVASICERLAKNFRHYRSGFPDLVVWNESNCIFAEVKGPGDTLSAKQSLWLDFLVSIGAHAEVCHVKSVSNKRIRLMPGVDDS